MQDFALLAPVLAPLSAAFLLPLASLLSRRFAPLITLPAMAISLAALLSLARPVFGAGQVLVYWLGGWTPVDGLAIGINFAVDAWGLLIALNIALVGLLAAIYSIPYMAEETGKEGYYALLMLLLAALIGFCLTGDLFNQFVWLEILSFSAFALTAFHYQERIAVEGAFKYLITNSLASLFILTALALVYATTGALNLAAIAGEFGRSNGQIIALGLLFVGYATKTALVPWHFWLPDAHQVAPAPVSAVLSGALIKIGIYGIGRLLFTVTPVEFNQLVLNIFLAVAVLTMFVGGFQMLRQNSIKRILAYSSVSQMGYILLGLAIGTPMGIAAAALLVFMHAMAKSALFFGAGAIQHYGRASLLSEGGGLLRKMPATFGLMVAAGLSLSGFPLTIGFVSKALLEEAALEEGATWAALAAIFCGAFTFAGLARLLWVVFVRRPAGDGQPARSRAVSVRIREAHPLMLLAMAVPVTLSVAAGLAPWLPVEWFGAPAMTALMRPAAYVEAVLGPNGGLSALPALPAGLHAPSLLDWALWPAVIFIVVAGSALAYVSLPGNERRFWGLPGVNGLYRLVRRWHSGLLPDYVLWNAFGTAVLLVLFVAVFALGDGRGL